MWNDIRTYLTSTIDPQKKSSLIIVLNRYKNKEGNK